ncbi:MAG: sporulation initiation factor Spo0A C-terminal domain-containing protein [Bacillota bacterium]|nr:sporulation initiation factor Spo0A C-terminal domain-containing protein [Bacillota bacterium]
MVVSPHHALCEAIRRAAEGAGVEVAACCHEAGGLSQLVKTVCPEVLVLDAAFPGERGPELVRLVARAGEGVPPAILVLLSPADEREAPELLRAGASYYLVKPLHFETVVARVEQLSRGAQKWFGVAGSRPSRFRRGEARVAALLSELGVPEHFRGFTYLREAILLVLEEGGALRGVTTHLYPSIARKYGVSPAKVERSLRHAIEHAWTYGKLDLLYGFFGPAVDARKGKPTNSSFIARLADKVMIDLALS